MKSDAKLLEALALLERGDWQQAHAIVQQHKSDDAAWLHGAFRTHGGRIV